MARPRKTGLDYFPFDTDFFNDEKIVCIAGEFGIKGEIVAIKLLCAVYRNGYFLEWNEMQLLKILRQTPGVSAELFNQILNRLIRWEFFDASLFDSVKVLTSAGIQRRYFEATKFRLKDTELEYILIPEIKDYSLKNRVSQGKTPISQGKTPISQGKNPQIKRNKNKKINATHLQKSERAGDDYRAKIDELKNSRIWKEGVMKNLKLSSAQIDEMLEDMYLEMICRNFKTTTQNFQSFAFGWLIRKLTKSNGTQQQKGEDRFSRRRGTDTSVWKPEDYTETF